MEINIITCKYGYYLTEVLKYILGISSNLFGLKISKVFTRNSL